MKTERILRYTIIALLVIVFVATVWVSIPDRCVSLGEGVAAGYSGAPYVAYVDFSGMRAKIVLINASSGEEMVVSDPSKDAQLPRFAGDWLIWTEIAADGGRRVVWLNVSSGERLTLPVNVEGVHYSAIPEPALLLTEGENASLYLWNGSAFSRGEFRRTSSAWRAATCGTPPPTPFMTSSRGR